MSTTPVYYESFQVGEIKTDGDGARFIYDERWRASQGAFPISLTMPMSVDEHDASVLVPWLSNLLPESHALRVIGGRLGVAPEDVIGMLDHIGQDTAGALSIGRRRERGEPGYRPIEDEKSLEKIINDLPAKPFLVGDEGVSMSLAGVQTKLPLADIDGTLAVPINGAPSTHILKPDVKERLLGSVQNEAFCMVLAQLSGLEAAQVTTGVAGARSYLLVTRYDRKQAGPQLWHRLHQEDFCQALGRPPSAKYEHNKSGIKGPSIEDMLSMIERESNAAEKLYLLDAIIFNVLINNTDSHAKNYSIYLFKYGPRITPLYDLMCAAGAWDVTQNMAQDIAGENRGNYICGRHWQRMAVQCGLNPTAVLRRVEELATKVMAATKDAVAIVEDMPAGGHLLMKDFSKTVQGRCQSVLLNLAKRDQAISLEEPLEVGPASTSRDGPGF